MVIQAKEVILKAIDNKPQTKIDSFFSFTDATANMAKGRINKSKVLSASDVIGLTCEDLLQPIKLQEDSDLRNSLQMKVGLIEKFDVKKWAESLNR